MKMKMKTTIGLESSSDLKAHSIGSADGEIWLWGPETNSGGHKEWGINEGRYGCAYIVCAFYSRKEAVAELRRLRRDRADSAETRKMEETYRQGERWLPATRFIIGKSEANGLTSFSADDIFEKDGEIFRLCCGGGGWTLRRTIKADGYRTDYIAPPLDGWMELPSAIAIAQKLNEAASHE